MRFLPPTDSSNVCAAKEGEKKGHKARSSPAISPRKATQSQSVVFANVKSPPTVYSKSLSISDLMKAGKLVKPPKTAVLNLEYFDVQKCCWSVNSGSFRLEIDENKFAIGAFRNAFRAKCNDPLSNLKGEWVTKKYQEASINTIKDSLKLSVEAHTHKQVQMQCC